MRDKRRYNVYLNAMHGCILGMYKGRGSLNVLTYEAMVANNSRMETDIAAPSANFREMISYTSSRKSHSIGGKAMNM